MSLIKDIETGNVKVATFDQIPINSNYYVKEYIDLNGNSFNPFTVETNDAFRDELKLSDTVMIQMNLYSGSTVYSGYVFSDTSSTTGSDMCIMVSGGYIYWYFGTYNWQSGYYCRVEIEKGVHIFGFANGKPFYDNQILYDSNKSVDTDTKFIYNKNTSTASNFTVKGGKIYRLIIQCASTGKTYSYYPCGTGTGALNHNFKIYEALSTGTFLDETFTD